MTELEKAIARGVALRDEMEQFFKQHLADLTAGGMRVKASDGRDVTAEARRDIENTLGLLKKTEQTLASLRAN